MHELKHKVTNQRFAMKEMNMINKNQLAKAAAEAQMLMEIMTNIKHPNILCIEKVFQVINCLIV